MSKALSKIIREDIEFIVSQDLDWSMFQNATVLISGANGFLPAYLVETLLFLNESKGANIKVVALVRDEEKALKKFQHHQHDPHLRFLVQDVCDPIDSDQIGNIDFIIHAASLASPKFYGTDPVGTISPNVIGTANLLKLAKEKSVRGFLFFSSGEVYGEMTTDLIPTKETDFGYINPATVRACYGESKRLGETLCVAWHHQYGVPVKIVRPFHTYGPGMDLEDGRVFADFVSDILHNRDIVMKSDGKNTRAFCYLADATAGFFTVLLKGEPGQAYNVGFDKETSIVELAEMLAGLFPEKNLKTIKMAAPVAGPTLNQVQRTCPDITKARSLGWLPTTNIQDGFRRTILSYQQ
jgi:UDP-glucuronate decarboxylase